MLNKPICIVFCLMLTAALGWGESFGSADRDLLHDIELTAFDVQAQDEHVKNPDEDDTDDGKRIILTVNLRNKSAYTEIDKALVAMFEEHGIPLHVESTTKEPWREFAGSVVTYQVSIKLFNNAVELLAENPKNVNYYGHWNADIAVTTGYELRWIAACRLWADKEGRIELNPKEKEQLDDLRAFLRENDSAAVNFDTSERDGFKTLYLCVEESDLFSIRNKIADEVCKSPERWNLLWLRLDLLPE